MITPTALHTEVCTALLMTAESSDLRVEPVDPEMLRVTVQRQGLRRLWRTRRARLTRVEAVLEGLGYRTHRGASTDLFVFSPRDLA